MAVKIINFPKSTIVPCANCEAEVYITGSVDCNQAVFIFCDENCENEFKTNQGMTDWNNMAVG